MKTTLYLVVSPSSRSRNWASVLTEEGYDVILVDPHSTGTRVDSSIDYGIITIGLSDELSLTNILLIESHPPKLAIHCGLESLKPVGELVELAYPVVLHLAQDQDDVGSSLATLPRSLVSLPPTSSDGDDSNTAETPLPYPNNSLIRSFQYLNTVGTRAEMWTTSLPFASQTSESAFEDGVTEWERSASGLIYTRIIEAIKAALGPCYDLERLWERHTRFEFEARDATKTMSTMIPQPYVNHVACMTGGAGYNDLLNFYTHNFVTRSPPDTELIPISRTIGADRVVDEMIFRCTHTCEIEYFLPGVAPTGKKLEISMVAIVNFRGSKLAFESLYWDQASTLVQLGLLDPKGLPIAGSEVGRKVLDPYRQPSNQLFGQEARKRSSSGIGAAEAKEAGK